VPYPPWRKPISLYAVCFPLFICSLNTLRAEVEAAQVLLSHSHRAGLRGGTWLLIQTGLGVRGNPARQLQVPLPGVTTPICSHWVPTGPLGRRSQPRGHPWPQAGAPRVTPTRCAAPGVSPLVHPHGCRSAPRTPEAAAQVSTTAPRPPCSLCRGSAHGDPRGRGPLRPKAGGRRGSAGAERQRPGLCSSARRPAQDPGPCSPSAQTQLRCLATPPVIY